MATEVQLHQISSVINLPLELARGRAAFDLWIKYHHYLELISLTYTISFTDQIASLDKHIDESIIFRKRVESNFIVFLPDSFYKAISILTQTMCMLKGQTHRLKVSNPNTYK